MLKNGVSLMSIIKRVSETGVLVDNFILKMLYLNTSDDFSEVVNHQILTGGKRVRPAMTIYCSKAVGGSVKDAISAAAGIELIHNYTLIFDDIIDRSNLRRGHPTTRAEYSDVMALLAGMLYREAIYLSSQYSSKSKQIESLFSSTTSKIIEGERLDILYEQAGRESDYINKKIHRNVSEADYLRMVELKTAALFEAACEVGGIVGGGNNEQIQALSNFGRCCGMAFQILDDVLDIFGEYEAFGKEIGKDIREHKFSNIAILYGLEELPKSENAKLLNILKTSNISDSQVKKAIKLLYTTNCRQRACDAASNYVKRAKSFLNSVELLEEKDVLIELANYLVERNY
jgi:geranylgeranyl diphosphate synthase type I